MRNNALLVVNSLLMLSMSLQFISGFMLRVAPIFRFIHFNNPYLLIILIALHLMFNWWWIKKWVFRIGMKGSPGK